MILGYTASMSSAQRRELEIKASREFASQMRKQLPTEVRTIMDETPVATEAPVVQEALGAKPEGGPAVIGTGSVDPVPAQAAEIAALAHVHRW